MTPKQRRQQDIFKRKTSDISKKYPREVIEEQLPSGSEMVPEGSGMGLEDESLKPGKEYMKRGGAMKPTKAQKKISKVMGEYKKGELRSGSKKGPVVKNPKQAIAIALSEAGKSKMKKRGGGMAMAGMGAALQEGGMVRGTGAAIKGVRKAKMY